MTSRPLIIALLGIVGCGDDSSPLRPPVDRLPRSYRIEADGTGDYPTIQAAIDASQDGDTIWLANGRYQGNGNRDLVLSKGHLLLQSISGDPVNCIIDCDGTIADPHRGMTLLSAAGAGVRIQDITIEDGYALGGGGGVRLEPNASPILSNVVFRAHQVVAVSSDGASPTIQRCVFRNNLDGAIMISGGSPTMSFCTFSDNYVDDRGAGIALYAGELTISNCEFSRNSSFFGGAAIYAANLVTGSNLAIVATDCTFSENVAGYHGGAVYLSGVTAQFVNCSFLGNAAAAKGGAAWLNSGSMGDFSTCLFYGNHGAEGAALNSTASTVTLTQTIVCNNRGGHAVVCDTGPGPATASFSCSDMYGNELGDWTACVETQLGTNDNIAADPMFCDPSNADFTLQPGSPCIPPASLCGAMGPFPVGCDLVPALSDPKR